MLKNFNRSIMIIILMGQSEIEDLLMTFVREKCDPGIGVL